MEITLPQLCQLLQGMLTIDFGVQERRLTSHFLTAEPAIQIEKQHIQNAIDQRKRGCITDRELSDWAAMLLMNDAYDWQGTDEDEVADSLNDLSTLWLSTESKPSRDQ